MSTAIIEKWIPGLHTIRTYNREWFGSDALAGLSIAAVALPIGIAYASLANFPPVVGIYSCILPLVAYAFFGSSRSFFVSNTRSALLLRADTYAREPSGDSTRRTALHPAGTV